MDEKEAELFKFLGVNAPRLRQRLIAPLSFAPQWYNNNLRW